MAHVTLHGAEVDTRFKQRRGKGMPERFDILLHLIDRY
jgi:hypothetical protein